MNVVLHDVPWDGGAAMRVAIRGDDGDETTMGHLWCHAADKTTWQYSIETHFNPSDTKALKFEAADRDDLYRQVVERIRIVKIPRNRVADESMHATVSQILATMADMAKETKSQQGYMGAIYGAIARFAVAEVKPEKREAFLQRVVVDIKSTFDHYLVLYGVAQQAAEVLQEAIAKVGDGEEAPPVH